MDDNHSRGITEVLMTARYDNDVRFGRDQAIFDWLRCDDGKRARVYVARKTIEDRGLHELQRSAIRAAFNVWKQQHLQAAEQAARSAPGHYVMYEIPADTACVA
jgi:hypothetical protein